MESPLLIGIHLGTSEVKVDVYDAEGALLDSGESAVSEQSTTAWERSLREATPELPETGLCSVASTSGTALLVDEYGEPVFPPQMYYDSAPEGAAKLRALVGDTDEPGWEIAMSPTAPLPKIIELREASPERFSNVEWILSPSTWLLYRLAYGNSTRWLDVETDWTNALKFGADIRPRMPEWHYALFADADLPRSLFPTIRPPGSFVDVAQSELADRIGFDGLRLFQGLTDGNASVLANGCFDPGDFSITFGAASVIKAVSETISQHDALYHHRHPIEGYLPGAAFDSGNALRWFFERVLDVTPERGLELASSVAAGEEYELFLPGNRGPFFDPDIGGSILGLDYDMSLSTDEVQGRLARGLTTGIVLSEWAYLAIIEDHFDTRIENVRVMNDGAPNFRNYDWWNRLRTSLWERQVTEMEARTTAGLLIPPALITSVYADTDEAKSKLLRARTVVEPDPELGEVYERRRDVYFDRWRQIADLYGSV